MNKSSCFCLAATAAMLTGAVVSAAPTVSVTAPAPGSTVSPLTSISVTFSEPVSAVDADDLLINAEAASGLTGSGAGPYVFSFTQPSPGTVSVSWDFDHGIAGTAGTGAFAPTGGWTYTLTDTIAPTIGKIRTSVAGQEMDAQVPVVGVTVGTLAQAEVTFSESVMGVDAADLLINNVAATGLAGAGAGPYTFSFAQPAAGVVTFQWAAAAGIVDGAGNPFAGGSWTATLVAGGPGSVAITEFLAGNATGLTDENGDSSDWIELTNTGASAVNLVGWTLSTDLDQPDMWIFPSRTLAAGARLIVFASGKDRKPAAGNLHTNFSLNLNGGDLALYGPGSPRTVVSAFTNYPEQRYDYSFGMMADMSLRYFSPPTPNAANAATGLTSLTPAPTASVGRGFFKEPFQLVLSCADVAATIRYTLDGTLPLATSPAYTTPLGVAATTVLRAAAFNAARVPSATITHSYIYLDQALTQPSPPYDNPARADDNTNPPLPTVGTSATAFPIAWGSNGNYGFPGVVTNLNASQIPADYGMDPEIINDPVKYDGTGAVNAAAGKLNLDRIKQGLRDLPILSIVMKNDDMFGAAGIYPNSTSKGTAYEKPCSVELLMPDGTTGFATTCGIRIHGNASRDPGKNPKHGFKLNFKGAFGAASLAYALFPDTPVKEFDDIIVRADFNSSWTHWDGGTQRPKATRLRDAFCKDTFRDMGREAGHHRYVNLFINGIYWGTYDPTEQENNGFAAAHFGGSKDDYDVMEQGGLKSGTITAYSAMTAMTSPIDNPKYEQMKQYLDVPWFIDYMLLHFYLGHEDWGDDINKNWYGVRNARTGGKYRFLPWDMENLLWSQTVDRTGVASPTAGLHPKLVTNAQYRLDFADRIHRFMVAPDGALQPAANIARWNKWKAILTNAIACESARWGDYRRDVHQYSSGPYVLHKWNVDWITEINRLTGTYFPARTAIVLGQLRTRTLYPTLNAPEFRNNSDNAHTGSARVASGYQLKIQLPTPAPSGTTSAGTIYFTTDGTDPRVYYDTTGQRTPSAQTYGGPITISATTTVRARALNGAVWSAMMEATFSMGSPLPPVRITEINYNPKNSQGSSASEFIELQNTGTQNIDLSDWYLRGVDFIFPIGFVLGAGDRMVLASNSAPAVFAAQYPSVAVAGWFGGSLDNGGERLSLHDRSDRVVCGVEYGDVAPWPTAADGGGYSLEIIDPDGDPQSPFNWQASLAVKGTPGAANSISGNVPSGIVINEFLANNNGVYTTGGTAPGYIELLNSGLGTVDLSGWIVTTREVPAGYEFPQGTTLAVGQYLVVHATAVPLPGPRLSLPLSIEWDEVTLVHSTGLRMDSARYGQQAAGFSFGRSGNAWVLGTPTPGAGNVAATTAPLSSLRINEWFANPAPGFGDWLELFNSNASLPVVLTGLHAGAGIELFRVKAPAAIAPGAWLRVDCDGGAQRPSAFLFQLPASGATLTLGAANGDVFDTIAFGPQVQDVSQGRLPDGTGAVTTLSYPSPGLPNAAALTGVPQLNEVLLVNENGDNAPWARRPGWVELRNPNVGAINLSGWRLRTVSHAPQTWTIPTGVNLPAAGHLAVWSDPLQPASLTAALHLNSGLPLGNDYSSWGVELLNPTGQVADRITWGLQIPDLSIGRIADGSWALLTAPTRGTANTGAASLGATSAVRLNEWLATTAPGSFPKFVELHNSQPAIVSLGGLWLADEPSEVGRRKWQIPALSFVAAQKQVLFLPGHDTPTPNVFPFDLDSGGEYLRLGQNDANTTALDAVSFGAMTAPPTQSQGRLPDGTVAIGAMTPTPGLPNGAQPPGPVFVVQPRSTAAPASQPLTLTAASPDALALKWQRNGFDIPGATGMALVFPALTGVDDATYTCVATNAAGTTTSQPARVTVLFTFAAWAAEKGAGSGADDPDGDGLNNVAEFLAGTDPISAATAAERAANHQTGGFESAAGTDFLTMDLRLSRRAAFSQLQGELSTGLTLWSAVDPAAIQFLDTAPNGDQRLRFKFVLPPQSPREFLRMKLVP